MKKSITARRPIGAFAPARFLVLLAALLGAVCALQPQPAASAAQLHADQLAIVDCLLPAAVRQLGGMMTYLAPRQPIKSTASECEIRGGEYVAFDRANFATSLQVWLPKAKDGDPQAQTYVGEIYEKGMGMPSDYAKAADWYRKAADQGFAKAQSNLAYLYEQGLGVPKDPVLALNLYRKSSGIKDDDLTYTSEVTAVRTEMQAKIDDLSAQLDSQTTAADALRHKLDAEHAQIDAQTAQLLEARRQVSGLRTRVAQMSADDSGKSAAAIQQARAQLEAGQRQLDEQQAQLDALKRSSDGEASRLTSQLAAAAAEADQLRRQLGQRSAEAETARAQLAAANARLALTNEQIRKLSAEAGEARQRLSAAESAAKTPDHSAELQTLRARLTASEQAVQSLQHERQQTEAKVASLTQAAAASERRLGEKSAEAQTAKAELAAANARLGVMNGRMNKLSAEAGEARERLSAAEAAPKTPDRTPELNALRARLAASEQAVRSLQHERQETEARVASLTQSAAASDQQLQASRAEIASLKQRALESAQRLSAANQQLGVLEQQLAADQKRLASGQMRDEDMQALQARVLEQEVKLGEQRRTIVGLQAEEDTYRAQIDQLRKNAPVAQVASIDPVMRGTAPKLSLPANVQLGNYHALLIGNNNYENMPNLSTAAADAEAVARVLRTKYGFETRVLRDATTDQIMGAINDYRKSLREQDNLLIYYAGHGHLDEKNFRAYWLPVNAKRDDTTGWISDQMITDQLNVMSARHVIIVADSCYAGAMTRGTGPLLISKAQRRLIYEAGSVSRTVLTSGGVAPVVDSGPGGNSVFARALMDALEKNDSVIDGTELYDQIFDVVKGAAKRLFKVDQSPVYAKIRDAGHINGDFIFAPRA